MKKVLLFAIAITFCLVSKAQINSSSFDSKVDFSIGANGGLSIATGDLDGDGRKDVVVSNQSNGVISIFRNTSTSGSVSFATRIDSTIGGQIGFISLDDLDGDGMLDIIVAVGSTTTGSIAIYRNVSTTGNILIAAKQVVSMGANGAFGLAIADMDGDGKDDIVIPNYYSSSYSILRNTSTSSSISFATIATTSISPSFNNPSQIILSDIDADGKKDIIAFCSGSGGSIGIFRNTTTTAGSITISSTAVSLSANACYRGDIADADGDGKLDIVASNNTSSNSALFRNTSTSGSISFATKVDFASTGSSMQSSLLRDLDADGKPEIVQSSGAAGGSKISIYRNFATSGTISTSSFGTRLDITAADVPSGLDVADMDGDGKLDILSANFSASSFSVFRSLVVPSDGLMVYYPFTGNAGDSSGFVNNGTVTGASLATDRNGSSNKAYSFNGSSNYITTSNTTGLLLNTYTYSLWVNPSSLPTSGTMGVLLDVGTTTADQFIGIANVSGSVGFGYGSYYNTSSANAYWTGTLPSTGTWYHVALTRSADSLKLYINGVLVDGRQTSSSSAAYGSSAYQCHIGRRVGSGSQYFSGSIDEVKIYGKVLNLSEIQQLADVTPPIPITHYYSNTTGYLDSLNTWGTNSDGSGTHPLSFDSSNTVYNVVNNASPTQSADWIVTGVNTAIVFGDGTNSINMSVPSGLICGSDSIYIRNGVTYTVDGTLFYNKLNMEDGSTVQYLSTGAETLIPVSYSNLVVYGGTKSISGNTSVRGTLAMIADIDCGGDTLTLGRSASQTGTLSYTSGAIKGAFSRWFATSPNSGSTGLFPMGSSSQYNPIQVEYTTAPTSGGVLTAVFTSPTTGTIRFSSIIDFSISPAVSLKKVSPDGFWTITPSKGLTGGTYKATATATGFSGISSISGLRLLRRDNSSSAWTLPASSSAIAVTGSTSSPVVGRSGLGTASSSRDFGIAADSSVNPLPVELISFEGNRITDNSVLLNWVTSQEFNNDHFEIERLTNTQWNSIGRIKGSINSAQLNNYSFIDEQAFHNKISTEYYRLKQVDVDGNYEYSQTISVSSLKTKQTEALVVFPNPSNASITVKGLKQEAIVRDALGNEVNRIVADGILDITPLKQGVYFIQSGSQIQKLIKY